MEKCCSENKPYRNQICDILFESCFELFRSCKLIFLESNDDDDDDGGGEAVEHVVLECERYEIDRREIMQGILTKLKHSINKRLNKTCRRKRIDGGVAGTMKRDECKG